ncbi:hypothetical protein [Catellatospora sichuanensis]|uniref:hypothetical protein n=1 Tax=Catellatospora sichuanensis TaxID=1969805 RepID=UPI0011838634|nr:hypothetical protein [Catellatospora sichuanensis]
MPTPPSPWRRRLAVTAAALALAAALPAPAALADPGTPPNIVHPNVGWSGSWEFQDGNNWSYSLVMPMGTVTGTGYDDSSVRVFAGTVTDTTPDPNICAYLTFAEAGGAQTYIACDGSVPFYQVDPTPTEYTFTLHVRDVSDDYHYSAMSKLVVPSTKYHTALRADGVGAKWQWVSATTAEFKIVRPSAVVTGTAVGYGSRAVTAITYAFTCARTTVLDDDTLKGQSETCNNTTVASATTHHEFEVRSCLVESVLGGRPGATKCVPLLVR